MQTGPFTCAALSYDSAGERWERIRQLLIQHGGVVRPAMEEKECPAMYMRVRNQSICFQDQFSRLSPEEIRWRQRWKPGHGSGKPHADAADMSEVPQNPLPFYGFLGQDTGNNGVQVVLQHISSQHPYSDHSAEEARLWDYSVGRRYPPASSSEVSETAVRPTAASDVAPTVGIFGAGFRPGEFSGPFGDSQSAPTGMLGSSSGRRLSGDAGFGASGSNPTSQEGQGGVGQGTSGGLFGSDFAPGLFGTASPVRGLFGTPGDAWETIWGRPSSGGGLFGTTGNSGGSLFDSGTSIRLPFAPAGSSNAGLFDSGSSNGGLFGLTTNSTGSLLGSGSAGSGLGTSSASPSLFGSEAAQGGLASANFRLFTGSSLDHGSDTEDTEDGSSSSQVGLSGERPVVGPAVSVLAQANDENNEGPDASSQPSSSVEGSETRAGTEEMCNASST
jgi:hypothetical protein